MAARHGRRVVITGWGVVSPVGLTADETWDALVAGRSGIGNVTVVDASDLPTDLAGEVKGFEPKKYLNHKQLRRMDPYAQYAFAAASEAVGTAKLEITEDDAHRVGALIGSGYGPMQSLG